nr:9738_t:CDS:2 [Entrophospora candida]
MSRSVELIGSVPITLGAQYPQIFNHNDLPVVADQLSVTLRLKLRNHSSEYWSTIFHKGTGNNTRTPGLWLTQAGRLYARFSSTSSTDEGTQELAPLLSLNQWYHIAYTISNPEKKLNVYLDGRLISSYKFQQNVIFNDGPLNIGRAHIHIGIDGEISNFRYFNWCISDKRVQADFEGDKIKELIANNEQWSSENVNNKLFFNQLTKQEPQVLWIGCVDSRVPPELITKSGFGELFVHRNVANQIKLDDANCMSVLEYAVNHLKVSHIVICGHTGCGGVKNSFESHLESNLIKWLKGMFGPTKPANFDTLEGQEQLVKDNVVKQINQVKNIDFVKAASQIQIHGFVFDLKNGLLLKVPA